jgi:VanZ family protein
MMRVIKKLSGRRTLLVLGVVYTVFVTYALLTEISGVPPIDIPFVDKYLHVIIHWGLSFIWLSYLYLGDQNHFSSKLVVLALITCFFYGIVVEAFQHWFTETRTFDFFDIPANAVGELLGLLSFRVVIKKLRDAS